MKALILRRPGSILNMRLEETEDPVQEKNEVLVQLHAASLNPTDYKLALSGLPSLKYPHILGMDGAGTIRSISPESAQSTGLREGMRVCFLADQRNRGTFAEFVSVPAESLAVIPEGISFETAASIPCAGISAWRALVKKSAVSSGMDVLIHGGAGGVGSFAIQIAKLKGARVITTCSPVNNDFVRTLGADETIDYSHEPVKDRILELTGGKGVDIAIDGIGSISATYTLSTLAYDGHLVCLSGLPDLSKQSGTGLSVHEIAMGGYYTHGGDAKALAENLDQLLGLVKEGKLHTFVGKEIGPEDIPACLEELRDRHVRGKIIAKLAKFPELPDR